MHSKRLSQMTGSFFGIYEVGGLATTGLKIEMVGSLCAWDREVVDSPAVCLQIFSLRLIVVLDLIVFF